MLDLMNVDQDRLQKIIAKIENQIAPDVINPILLYKAKLNEDGWVLGQEAIPCAGKEILVLFPSFRQGYVAFERKESLEGKPVSSGKKLGEVSAYIFSEDEVSDAELRSFPDAKVLPQLSVLVHIDGEQAEMKGSTAGMIDAMRLLLSKGLTRLRAGAKTYINPYVRLGCSSYIHDAWGKTYYPVLDVLDWRNDKNESEPSTPRITDRV